MMVAKTVPKELSAQNNSMEAGARPEKKNSPVSKFQSLLSSLKQQVKTPGDSDKLAKAGKTTGLIKTAKTAKSGKPEKASLEKPELKKNLPQDKNRLATALYKTAEHAAPIEESGNTKLLPLEKRNKKEDDKKSQAFTLASVDRQPDKVNSEKVSQVKESAAPEQIVPKDAKEPVIRVIDLRMKAAEGQKQKAPVEKAMTEQQSRKADRSVDGNPVMIASRPVGQLVDDTSLPVGKSEATSLQSQAQELAARIKSGGAGEIVKAAQIVLKDGDIGIIRLKLEPQSLGGVKIELKLAEKQISGRIVVESDLAENAFRSSLDALKDAFAEAGFETTALEVEVSDRKHGESGEDDGLEPYWSKGVEKLAASVPEFTEGIAIDSGLNIFV